MSDFIQPEEISVKSLLESVKNFKIPAYQRPYEWSLDNNWALYQDLTDLSNYHDSKSEKRQYYLGPIYVANNKLLDGQQRAVSLTIWNNAEIRAQRFYTDWISSWRDPDSSLAKLELAENSLSALEIEISQAFSVIEKKITELKKATKEGNLSIKNQLFNSLKNEVAYVDRIKDLINALNKLPANKLTKEINGLIQDISKKVAEISFEVRRKRVDEVNACKAALKVDTLPLVFSKKELLFRKKTKPIDLAENARELVKEVHDSLTKLSDADDVKFCEDEEIISFVFDNHVSNFEVVEELWDSLLTGRFSFKKKKTLPDTLELAVEIYRAPKGKGASKKFENFWEKQISGKTEDSDFLAFSDVEKIINKNTRLAPFVKRYLLAYVMYFFNSLGAILVQKKFLGLSDIKQEIVVNKKSLPSFSLSSIKESVKVVKMVLEDSFLSNAQRMFHTINSRGVGLSDADKVRNLLLGNENKDEITEAFTELVDMFLKASQASLNLGFEENDVFYWAHHSIVSGNVTQKQFIADVEHNLGLGNEDYVTDFVRYMRDFSAFVKWLCVQKEDPNESWIEYRLVLLLSYPKASFPVLFALYSAYEKSLTGTDDIKRYQFLIRGFGYFLAKRRDTKFQSSEKKVESIQALLSRSLRTASSVNEAQTKALSDSLKHLSRLWFPSGGDIDDPARVLLEIDNSFAGSKSSGVFTNFLDDDWNKYYGRSGVNVLTKYALMSTASDRGVPEAWYSDIEHLYYAQSGEDSNRHRLGNLFLLDPSLNRSLGDLEPKMKYDALCTKREDNRQIGKTEVFKWLKENFTNSKGEWKVPAEKKLEKAFKTRETEVAKHLRDRSKQWSDMMIASK